MVAAEQMLDPIFAGETAQRVLDFTLDDEARQRLDYLRQRANEGELSEPERAEYERFVENLDLLAILKAEARAALDRRAG